MKFRQRIGEPGIEKILKLTIDLNGDRALEKEMVADTTVEEKQVTFPTDAKLQCKVIKHCRQIAKKEGLPLRQSYQKVLKSLIRALHNPQRRPVEKSKPLPAVYGVNSCENGLRTKNPSMRIG